MSWPHLIVRLAGACAALLLTAVGSFSQSSSPLHTGRLAQGDPQLESGEYYEQYSLNASSGQEIIAVAMSLDFDPYLILISPSGEQKDNDDFGGSSDVSLIEVPVDEAGTWRIRVTTYESGETGEFAVMAATRPADGEDVGGDEIIEEEEPEDFDVKGTIAPGAPVSGTLDEADPKRFDGSYYEAYALDATPGMQVVITLESEDFDPYLTLVSPSGEKESNDDAEEGNYSSRIDATLAESGRWLVVANTLGEGETGDYRLVVTRK